MKKEEYIEVCLVEKPEKKKLGIHLQSNSGVLENPLIKRILKVTPHTVIIEITGYEVSGSTLSQLTVDKFNPIMKLKGIILDHHHIDMEGYRIIKEKVHTFSRKIKLTNFDEVTRILIGERKNPLLFGLAKQLTISLIPVISKEVDKKELKRILEGIQKVEEEIFEEKKEPAGRELFISSLDIYTIEDGKKRKLVSYDLEGGLYIYMHEPEGGGDEG